MYLTTLATMYCPLCGQTADKPMNTYFFISLFLLVLPTLILHAKDDKLASFADAEKALCRFSDCTFVAFETGGHLMAGHKNEVQEAVRGFIEAQRLKRNTGLGLEQEEM